MMMMMMMMVEGFRPEAGLPHPTFDHQTLCLTITRSGVPLCIPERTSVHSRNAI